MFKYFGCSWMFVESSGWILPVGDIASEFGGVRGCLRILQIPYIFYWFVYTIILYFSFFCKCIQYVVDDSRNKYDPFTQNNAYRM